MTLAALFVSSLAMAQNDPFWNPDANGDDLIGIADLMSILGVYGNSIGVDLTVTCDYDGTEIEEFVLALLNQSAILDSVFFEFTISGFSYSYVLGCPDPISNPWFYSNSGTSVTPSFESESFSDFNYIVSGADLSFSDDVTASFGCWAWDIYGPWELNSTMSASLSNDTTNLSVGLSLLDESTNNVPIQNPSVVWDSLGIHAIEMNSENYIRAIPYWHYAD